MRRFSTTRYLDACSNRVTLRAFFHIPSVLTVVVMLAMLMVMPQPATASHRPDTAPNIVNWDFQWSIDSQAQVEELSEWDVVIADIENEFYSRDELVELKELHPDIILLAYISLSDIRPDAAELQTGTARNYIGEQLEDNPDWILRNDKGKPVEWWPTYSIFNITNQALLINGKRFNDFYSAFVRDAIVKDTLWDGIFFDNLWDDISFVSTAVDLNQDGVAESAAIMDEEWRKGVQKILKKTRVNAKKYRNTFIVTGNGGVRYRQYLNGVGFEHFPTTVYGGWTSSMEQYFRIMQLVAHDPYSFINTNVNNTGNREDYKKFRYGLASTLMNDAYYSFDNGDQSHRERWFYDEYTVALGEPVSGAYNVLNENSPTTLEPGVWKRDYEHATVIVNSTAQSQTITFNNGLEKILGTQDTTVNNGEVVGTVTLPAEDGIILLERLTHVRDATFINGAFSKVFDGSGNQVRKSFFAYDGSFSGGLQVHKVSTSGKTVVANDTHVRVYNNRNELVASFAPYGETYTGGVNIAVGTLFGGEKTYIVTGNRTGPAHVRIFDINGTLKNPGCFPYAPEFRGGVNVAMGDLNGDNRQEIVVAAGLGGGPHVRVLSNTCEVINPGFFAYDKNLRIGVNMAVGDLNGDGKAEIVTGPGPGGGPHIRVFDRNGTLLSAGFFAYSESDRSGVLVSTADIDQDGIVEIVTSSFGVFNQL